MSELIIEAKWIVCGVVDRDSVEILEDAAVLQRDGIIVGFGSAAALQAQAPEAEVRRYPHHMVLPGFVNSHHHVGLTPLQLGSPDFPLEMWFASRIPARSIDLYLDTLYSAFEMISSGITTVQHIHGWMRGGYEVIESGARQVCSAYRDIGMRASYSFAMREQNRLVYEADEAFCARLPKDLGEQLAVFLKAQTLDLEDNFKLFDRLTADNADEGRVAIQLAPANLHWCSDDSLVALAEKSRSANVPMHMHVLETAYQKEYARRRTGKTAVRHLHDLGVLGPNMTMGHSVWVTEEDLEIAAHTGTCVCHNCSSNFRLRSGVAPLNSFAQKGLTVAMGLDEAGINDDRDMLQEMRLVLRAHRTPGMEDDVPTCPQVLRMATEHGALTTAFGATIGKLEAGRHFDAVVIDWNKATYPYQDDDIPPLDVVIQRAKTQDVTAVFCDGEAIYEDGRFTRVDRDAVLEEIAETLAKPRTAEDLARRALGHQVLPHVKSFYDNYTNEETRVPFYTPSSRV
ncbi:amidohydrolase family protein [Pseudooceanicola sp.]|uniref:amidohydrolase family protein n=1 Tax=Pseudooceanicola sp. TaxID=1914328 RepID=UPI00262F1356|nr:amidohydrolase family protein [Pseudooceanicola sp.]MDF1856067.1 amidohydrolase family protein [Pseudooceanicola sp.]